MVRLKKESNTGIQKSLINDNCKLTSRLPGFIFECNINCPKRIKPNSLLRAKGIYFCAYQKNKDISNNY